MFFVLLCFFMFCSFVGFCSDTLYIVLFRYVILFRFNKMDCTYTLLYIIDKGGRKNFFVRMYRLCFAMKRCRLSRTSLSAFTNTKVRH